MNTYTVTYFPEGGPSGMLSVSAEYWEYDAEFVAFYVDTSDSKTGRRDIVCAVPLDLSPIIVRK